MKIAYQIFFAVVWCITLPSSMVAQRFSAGVGAGVIMSQMDGDGFTGYDKLGKRVGLRGLAHITDRIDVVVEMNWEEKGARFESINDNKKSDNKNRTIDLAYAEIPVLCRFFLKERGGLFGEAGISISYLVKDRYRRGARAADLDQYEELAPRFNRSEWNAVLGGGIEFNRHVGVLFRTTFGFSYLYRDRSALDGYLNRPAGSLQEEPIVQLRNYLVSAGIYYII